MQTFPLVRVRGTARQMGIQHGEQAALLIERYLRWIEKSTGLDRDALGQRARAFLPFIESLNPLLLNEIRGIAEGASISFEHALLCQVRGEAIHAPLSDGCTAFALTRSATVDGHALAGQNQDLPLEFSDLGIVLHIEPTDGRPRVLTFTFAGQLGYMGTNEHGVSHFANGLADYEWKLGLPHYPLKRTLFEQRDVASCLQVVEKHHMCSAANMVFCDGNDDIADVEIRPEGIALFDDDHADKRLHTNHYITERFSPFETHGATDSAPRIRRIRQLVSEHWGQLDVELIKEILADHEGDPGAICRHGAGGTHSICGYIAEPARGRLHVRRGHGCTGTWTAYEV